VDFAILGDFQKGTHELYSLEAGFVGFYPEAGAAHHLVKVDGGRKEGTPTGSPKKISTVANIPGTLGNEQHGGNPFPVQIKRRSIEM
jgi:hypothetical protein